MAAPLTSVTQWLPGFDPDSVEFPDLFQSESIQRSFPTVDVVDLPESQPSDSEQLDEASNPLSKWRAPTVTKIEVARLPWFPLRSTTYQCPIGAAAKFNANIDAINLLQRLESSNALLTAEDATRLRRYCGWGGIPESFNLEHENSHWAFRAKELRTRLSDEDYTSALASVTNGHYTEPYVIESFWEAIERFGFKGGRILEPSAGIGHFIGAMPEAVARNSTITAIELDQLAGRILKTLYAPSGVDVRICGFESAQLSHNWFDLVIGNVPFGKYRVVDNSNRPYCRFKVHNYFFGRALDLVRPGGLVCLITSSYLFDGNDDSVRRYLATQGELLGAIRLPLDTFAKIALTHAQSDIVFLRKWQTLEKPGADWQSRSKVPASLLHPNCYQREMQVNTWYAANPDFCIGKISAESNGHELIPTAVFDGDLPSELRATVALLRSRVYEAAVSPKPQVQRPLLPLDKGMRPGSYQLRQGRVWQVRGGELVDLNDEISATLRSRIGGMCLIRDAARAVLEAQLADVTDDDLARLRRSLNAAYDHFVAKLGYLSSWANNLAFRRDPDYPLLLSLEHFDEATGTATKAAIFSKRTLTRVVEPKDADEPEEALAASIHWRGKVDPAYMAELLGATEQAVLDSLSEGGHIYLEPESGTWQTADEYLSGNVREKLHQAVASGQPYARNVEALKSVQPEDLGPELIQPRLGAVWIPAIDVETFIRQELGLGDCTVAYSARAGAWAVTYCKSIDQHNIKLTQEFGTSRMNAIQLVLCALNVQTPTVRDYSESANGYIINRDETLAAREKLGVIKDRFAIWLFEDIERRERLCRSYNDLFNATRPRRFDGSHLKLPGFSHCFELHPAQKDGIWRIVEGGNTGLFHAVGAGKTAECVAASMELRRLGFANKPCHVVPNHMLAQYTAEFVRMYPNASVLMATKEDLEGDRRRELVSRIATGDWDAVVITHSSFERIRMSPGFSKGFIRDIILEIEMAIRAEDSDDRSNRIVKQLELMKKNWNTKLEKLLASESKDDLLTWEMLGIDYLFTDEAHLFKNLYRFTKMTRVAGLPLVNSARAFDLFLKTRYLMQLHGDRQRGVVFATATPIANSMAEMHTMMRFLQPYRLEELNLQEFDAWAATFGELVTALEISPDGSGYRMHTRFARFINVPELMSIFGEVADIRTAEMLNLRVPKLVGGKARTISCPASKDVKDFVKTLVKRAEAIRRGEVKPYEDNMLAITTDGRKAALDFRLIERRAAFDPSGKVAACLRNIKEIWVRSVSYRGAQIVFCDLSAPKGCAAFSVYDDMRTRLIADGIPADEIAFIHDADTDTQKATLFKAVREGRIRVLFGSTAKMGIGTNVQTRLCALHHLDAPWRPCDVEQRDGRIMRQGNECVEVEILRYVTEGSFDAYIWQTLETKARFIAQVMKGDKGIRSIEDVELAALSYAEVKALASGNPLVIEKAGVDAEVAKLATLFTIWRSQRYANESEVARLPSIIEGIKRTIAAHLADCERVQAMTAETISVTIAGRQIFGALDVGDALRDIVRSVRDEVRFATGAIDRIIGTCAGLDLGIYANRHRDVPNLYLRGLCVYEAAQYLTGPTLVAELLATHTSVTKRHADAIEQHEAKQKRLEDIRRELGKSFEHEKKLAELLARQRELANQLDLDKDEVGTAGMNPDEEKEVA